MKNSLSDQEIERYKRTLLTEGFSEEDQIKIKESRVLVVGAGGVGSASLNYLCAAGVGNIGIVEFDSVSLSNLQRQVLYTTNDIYLSKALCAEKRLKAINPNCNITVYNKKLTSSNGNEIISGYDIILDCTDNYASRYLMDRICADLRKPFLYTSAEGTTAQLALFPNKEVFDKRYCDLFSEKELIQKEVVGVFPPLPGIAGSLQALEALKYITGKKCEIIGKLMVFDGISLSLQIFNV